MDPVMDPTMATEPPSHIAYVANPTPTSTHVPIPTHPSYAEMITAAITALNEQDGSSRQAIAKYIEQVYSNLPPTHSALLTHHLKRLKNEGHLVMVKHSYKLAGSAPPPPLPPVSANGDVNVDASFTPGPKKRPGRPPKPKPTYAPAFQPQAHDLLLPQAQLHPQDQAQFQPDSFPPVTQAIPGAAQADVGVGVGSDSNPVFVSLGLADGPEPGPIPISMKRGRGRPRKLDTGGALNVLRGPPGRPPKLGVKRGPGRPPKGGAALVVPGLGIAGRPRGRPKKGAAASATGRKRGRPKKNPAGFVPPMNAGPFAVVNGGAAVQWVPISDGTVADVATPGTKRRGRPPLIPGQPKKPRKLSGKPLGRPRKNATMMGVEASAAHQLAYQELKGKFEEFQSKVKQTVSLLRPCLNSETPVNVVAAFQELEELAGVNITTPSNVQVQEPVAPPPLTQN